VVGKKRRTTGGTVSMRGSGAKPGKSEAKAKGKDETDDEKKKAAKAAHAKKEREKYQARRKAVMERSSPAESMVENITNPKRMN